jgi:hypothetical protein
MSAARPGQARYQPVQGAHVYVERGFYSHHGVDCGDGTVIDFGGRDGAKDKDAAVIRRATLEEFANGAGVKTRPYGSCYEPEIVVAHATSMIGRSGYHLFSNNCEHFATWCIAGEHSSRQVEAVWSAAGMLGAGRFTPRIGADAVLGLGETAPRSAPNVMSGLKKLGGSAAGGVTVVAGTGALVGAGTMVFVLRDKPWLPDQERSALRVGRLAGFGGAAVGVGAAVHSVGALGVVGYSAAGLSSGLAALGGGGMVAGVAAVAMIPLLAAFGFALLAYGLTLYVKTPSAGSQAAI